MKILLDECLPAELRHSFRGHEAHTAHWAGFKGMKNGELLRAAEASGYEVFLTVDQGIQYQQAPAGRTLSIVVLRVRTNQLSDVVTLLPELLATLNRIRPGQLVSVPPGISVQ